MVDHISVCVCTYKRPHLLENLLQALLKQKTDNRFEYSILVIDNDANATARVAIEKIQGPSDLLINYKIEPIQNIAKARNLAVESSIGNLIAFIDDDEIPIENWLIELYNALCKYEVDGILGPVVPDYEEKPQDWIIRSKLYHRPRYESGTVIHWGESRTGNLLFRKSIVGENNRPFREAYGSQGEDIIFFKEMNERGFKFAWCNEAIVRETVFTERMTKKYLLKRALLQGYTSLNYIGYNPPIIFLKSLFAFTVYSLLLPFFYIAGMHLFMKYLIKDFHHLSRFLGIIGIKLSGDRNSLAVDTQEK